ncbi:MAG: ComEC/Rec2 family competence protein [Bacillota bacterium]|nr:ComEC/Rec2 family competence protein [Bacillota bacterium]
MPKRKSNRKLTIPLAIVLCIAAAISYLVQNGGNDTKAPVSSYPGDCTMEVHFIDVGQGMATLIRHQGGDILIDTGDRDAKDELFAYLEQEKVTEFTYVIGSHPHADHVANLDDVLLTYDVETLFLTDSPYDSKIWDDIHSAISDTGVNQESPKAGYTCSVEDVVLEFMAPLQDTKEYSDANDWSYVVKVTHGGDTFLFPGDATVYSENEMLAWYTHGELDVDVFEVSHHGSYLSNSPQFLRELTADQYVISCGKDNQYDHPSKETLSRIEEMDGGEIYRTDEDGSIVMKSSGNGITVE